MDNYEFLFGDDETMLASANAIEYICMDDDENPRKRLKWGGSVLGRKTINRDRVLGANQLHTDYFADSPVYNDKMFRRRFRMKRDLFLQIVEDMEENCDYFKQKENAAKVLGFTAIQKVTAAIRMLAYGTSGDSVDEYLRMAESTAIETLKIFCKTVINVYGEEYLRSPNAEDVAKLLKGKERGFPGMLGSIDCMHWTWKNCPTAWHGQYTGKEKMPTIVLEAVASKNLWIWHAFFGLPGALNDINVLDRSPVFQPVFDGSAPPISFVANGEQFDQGYYLADRIYPPYATFVSNISGIITRKEEIFNKAQEAARKDVERAFGVLQSRFAIIKGPARLWGQKDLANIMTACIILHNKIVEHEENNGEEELDYQYDSPPGTSSRDSVPVELSREPSDSFNSFVERCIKIRDRAENARLKKCLIEEQYMFSGNQHLY